MADVNLQLQHSSETPVDETSPEVVSEMAAVKRWLSRIAHSESVYADDYLRMQENTEFVAGIQNDGQTAIRDKEDRYICNLTLQLISSEKARLYARNPQAECIKKERMDFALWDGSIEMLKEAFMGVQQSQMTGMPDMQSFAVMSDFMQGKSMQKIVDKFCETFKILYQYQVDSAKPEFKEQMKQLVVRALTCGVGYCIPYFVRENTPTITSTEAPHNLVDRTKMAQLITSRLEDDDIQADDVQVETLKSLLLSIGTTNQYGGDYGYPERIEFDFPPATSIIPDTNCRSLREFTAAKWVAQKFMLSVDDANAFFELTGETAIKPMSDLNGTVNPDNNKIVALTADERNDPLIPKVALYRIWDYTTKSDLFIAKGHKFYVRVPTPLEPCVSGFWTIFTLLFNQIEVEPGSDSKVTIFPPSDVDQIRSPQKEYNRSREALRDQRNANAPTYLVRKGSLTDNDKDNIRNRTPNEIVELEQVPADKQPSDMVSVLQVAKIDPALYDTRPQESDVQFATGAQQADIGPAQPYTTATVGNIAEQNKQSNTGSKVDDLDCFLSRLARASGEMMIQSMSVDVVKEIVGPGAVWPESPEDRRRFMNQVELGIKAASSGRPNQQANVQKMQMIMPMLMQAGANPIAVIEALCEAMDDNMNHLDIQKFFPVPGQAMMTSGQNQNQNGGAANNAQAPNQPPAPPSAGAPPQQSALGQGPSYAQTSSAPPSGWVAPAAQPTAA